MENCIRGLKRSLYGSALLPPTSLQPVTVLLHTGAHVLTFSLREELRKTGLSSDGYRKLMEGTGLLLLPSQGEANRLGRRTRAAGFPTGSGTLLVLAQPYDSLEAIRSEVIQ